MNKFAAESNSIEETMALGKKLGSLCNGGEVLLFHGTLGAGKTCFLKGFARGLGVPENIDVVSPTFVLHSQYEGRITFNHIDAYRLDGAPDISDLGFEELFYDKYAATAVEWAEIIESFLPKTCLEITIEVTGENSRSFNFQTEDNDKNFYCPLIEKFSHQI
jgi:tRNA threonylcarbamoyladenosine biosynthesis protein TsaE